MEKEEVKRTNYEYLEKLRAQAVMEKAQRERDNVVETLVHHMVSRNLIEELTGEVVVHEKRVREDKTQQLREWVLKNLGKEFGTGELVKSLDASYETVLRTVKENPDYFVKVRRGLYAIRDGVAEREAAKKESK